MIRRLRALLSTTEPLPSHLHFHIDESGARYVCDESICRPKPATPFWLPR